MPVWKNLMLFLMLLVVNKVLQIFQHFVSSCPDTWFITILELEPGEGDKVQDNPTSSTESLNVSE